MNNPWSVPGIIQGRWVRIEPLRPDHAPGLCRVSDPADFRFFLNVYPRSSEPAEWDRYIAEMLALPGVMPFCVLGRDDRPLGMTSYMEMRPLHRGLEIGMTWIAAEARRGPVNPEQKLLLLRHAFGPMGCERVQLKCDADNAPSRGAILKLGATFEGILRKHGVRPDGTMRDTAMHSIVRSEWPEVEARLISRLNAFEPPIG